MKLAQGQGHRSDDLRRPWRLGVLLSGSGRTLENLLAVIDRGELDAEVVCALSSRADARGVDIARGANIPVTVVGLKGHANTAAYSRAVFDALEPFAPDLLVLAGFLRQLELPQDWVGRMLNIHPALLPQALEYAAGRGKYGDFVHAAVLERGDVVTGATVHVVTEEYDSGPPVMQREVPVLPGDTVASLAARVFEVECSLYPEAIRRYMADHPELLRGTSTS